MVGESVLCGSMTGRMRVSSADRLAAAAAELAGAAALIDGGPGCCGPQVFEMHSQHPGCLKFDSRLNVDWGCVGDHSLQLSRALYFQSQSLHTRARSRKRKAAATCSESCKHRKGALLPPNSPIMLPFHKPSTLLGAQSPCRCVSASGRPSTEVHSSRCCHPPGSPCVCCAVCVCRHPAPLLHARFCSHDGTARPRTATVTYARLPHMVRPRTRCCTCLPDSRNQGISCCCMLYPHTCCLHPAG